VTPSAACAWVLVDELVRGGVDEVVLAPGSRNAPLSLVLHAADAAGRVRLHVRVDERGAAFTALGLAKASGRPVAVVTTSGTAVANLHPAVCEADLSGVPLVVLSADRPPRLRDAGANQTLTQPGIFATAVRAVHDLGVPTGDVAALTAQAPYWRSAVCRLLRAATGADPGPVHLNVAFDTPLVPDGDDATRAPLVLAGRDGDAPWTRAPQPPGAGVGEDLPARTLVVVGDGPAWLGAATARLAAARGWPVVSEPSGGAGGAGTVDAAPLVLGVAALRAALRPDAVLVVGRPTLARSVTGLLEDPTLPVAVVAPAPARAPDAARRAQAVLGGLPPAAGVRDPGWLAAWQRVGAAARAAVDGVLADRRFGGAAAARDLLAALPAGGLLLAGSSLPVRDLFTTARARDDVTVLANRGAAGIDGTVATALGAALAHQRGGGGQAAALVGDLTFCHDASALLLGPDEPRPQLAVVVVNNNGGGLFSLLEQGRPAYAAAFERVFATPLAVDLAALAAASGTPHRRVGSADELATAVGDPREGLQVVEVLADAASERSTQADLADAVAEAVAAAL